MIYYLVYKIKYNTEKDTYDKIIGFEHKVEDDGLMLFTKPISVKPIGNVSLQLHNCFHVLMHPIENRFLTIDDMNVVMNILNPLNYTVNETLTKIEIKRNSNLVYVLSKNIN